MTKRSTARLRGRSAAVRVRHVGQAPGVALDRSVVSTVRPNPSPACERPAVERTSALVVVGRLLNVRM